MAPKNIFRLHALPNCKVFGMGTDFDDWHADTNTLAHL